MLIKLVWSDVLLLLIFDNATLFISHLCSLFIRFWCSLNLPIFSTTQMSPCCPFCNVVINAKPVRLIFNHNVDEETLDAAFASIYQDDEILVNADKLSTPSATPLSSPDVIEEGDAEDEDSTQLMPLTFDQSESCSRSMERSPLT